MELPNLCCLVCGAIIPNEYLKFWENIGYSSDIKTGPAFYCKCKIKLRTFKVNRKLVVIRDN